MSHYSNNSINNEKCQEVNTNFEKTKIMIAEIYKLRISSAPLRVLLYQIDQEFGHLDKGKIKNGDTINHGTRSKRLGISIKSDERASILLEKMNIFRIDKSFHENNIYYINTDVSTWIVNKKEKCNEKEN